MEEFKPTLCIICLDVTSNENCRATNETTKAILDFLLLKRLIEGNPSVICKVCLTKVVKAFRYKAICMDTENSIFPYLNSKNGAPVDLKWIYMKEVGKEHLQTTLEDKRICRLCIQIVTGGFTSVKDIEIDVFRIYIPEVNFNSTEDPVLCTTCLKSLKMHSDFLSNCLGGPKLENVDKNEERESQFEITTTEIEIKSEEGSENTETPLMPNELTDCKPEDTEGQEAGTYDSTTSDDQSEKGSNLTPHELTHNKPSQVLTYQCDKCEFETEYKEGFTRHQVVHKEISNVQMYKCDKCNFQTRHRGSITYHRLTHIDIPKAQSPTLHRITHKDTSEAQMYKCDECTYETRHKNDLRNHRLIHNEVSELYKCDLCSYKGRCKRNLRRHQLVHRDPSEVKMYKCDKCSYETRHRYGFRSHLLIHNEISKLYKCDLCSYKGRLKRNLRYHQRVHQDISEVQMYKCDKCSYESRHNNCLRNHLLKHNGISKLYKCDLCSYEGKSKQYLRRHQVIHRDISEVQMYKCDTCNFQSKYRKSLVYHLRKEGHFRKTDM